MGTFSDLAKRGAMRNLSVGARNFATSLQAIKTRKSQEALQMRKNQVAQDKLNLETKYKNAQIEKMGAETKQMQAEFDRANTQTSAKNALATYFPDNSGAMKFAIDSVNRLQGNPPNYDAWKPADFKAFNDQLKNKPFMDQIRKIKIDHWKGVQDDMKFLAENPKPVSEEGKERKKVLDNKYNGIKGAELAALSGKANSMLVELSDKKLTEQEKSNITQRRQEEMVDYKESKKKPSPSETRIRSKEASDAEEKILNPENAGKPSLSVAVRDFNQNSSTPYVYHYTEKEVPGVVYGTNITREVKRIDLPINKATGRQVTASDVQKTMAEQGWTFEQVLKYLGVLD